MEAQQRELRFRKIQEDRTLAMLRQAESRALEQQQQQQLYRQQAQPQQQGQRRDDDAIYQQRDNRPRVEEEEQKQRFDARANGQTQNPAFFTAAERARDSVYKYESEANARDNQLHQYLLSNPKRDEQRSVPSNQTAVDKPFARETYDKSANDHGRDVDAHDGQHKSGMERHARKPSHGFLHTIASIFKNN